MILKRLHIKVLIVTTFVVTMFFSCDYNEKKTNVTVIFQNQPVGEARDINLKYTEAKDTIGKVIANLESPKMLDYSNRSFSFYEFPEGVRLSLYDDKNQKNIVLADYAIVYKATDLIDLQGNVILITPQKDSLFAEQLYYDQKQEWLFSNLPVYLKSITANNGRGDIFDSDTKFTNYTILEGRGDMILKD